MMNDAMMLMKSRHNNTKQYLTGHARRAFLLLALMVFVNVALGQITNVSIGGVDNQNYGWLMSTYSIPQTLADIDPSSWDGDMVSNSGQHWDGTTTSNYYEQTGSDWSGSTWNRKMYTTITLPKGKYLLMGAARASADVNAYMKVTSGSVSRDISIVSKGNTGKGIDVNGIATSTDASASGTFSNNGNGGGWEYRYITFDVTADNTAVTIEVGGSTTDHINKWMSFTTPLLRKSTDDNTSMASLNVMDASLFHNWSRPEPGATVKGTVSVGTCNLNTPVSCAYGDGNVNYLNYADLSNYKYLKLVVLEGTPRLLFNRQAPNGSDPNGGDFITINSVNSPYVTAQNSIWYIDLEKFRMDNGGYVHLNSIKDAGYGNISLESMTLYSQPLELTSELFHKWNGVVENPSQSTDPDNCEVNFGSPKVGGVTLYGTGAVWCQHYADLTSYDKLEIAFSGPVPRLLFNRQNDNTNDNGLIEINAYQGTEYYTVENGVMIVDLKKFRKEHGEYAHLNAMKVASGGDGTAVYSAHLFKESEANTTNLFEMGNESGCQTHVLYQLDEGATSFTVNLSQFKDKILEAYGKSSLSDIGSGTGDRLYLRWYILDKNTNKYLPVQNELMSATGSTAGNHYGEDVGFLWLGAPSDANFADAANVNVDFGGLNSKISTPYTQSNVTMACVMSELPADIWGGHEPTNLQHKFIVRFISDETAQNNNDFVVANTNPNKSFSKQIKVEQGATVTTAGQLQNALTDLYNQAYASAISLNGALPQYLRVYLTNGSGSAINSAKSDNLTLYFSTPKDGNNNDIAIQNKVSNGYVWVKQSSNSFSTDVFNTILTKPDAYEWDNLRVVCDLTDDLTGSYFVGSGIMEEPTNLKARLIVRFKEGNGDGYSAATSELTTGTTIIRKHNSTETASLDLATSENFSDVNAKFDNHLNDYSNVEKLYIRWYIADKDGDWVPTPAGITLSPANSGYADKIVDEKNYGKVLYLGNAGATVTADMLRMNITVTNADVDLDDYQVVCALTYADEGYTTEPTLKAKYIYSFVSPFEGKLTADAIEHSKEVIVTRDDQSAGYVTIPLDEYYSEILSDFNTNATELGQNLHVRWYVVHNDEQYLRSDLQLLAVNNTDYKVHEGSNTTEGYLYWNTATSSSTTTQGRLNVKFTIPTIDTHWENYKIIAVMSNDISADNGQVVSGGELVREPQSLNMIYTFSLVDGIFKFVHYQGESGRDYFTHSDDVNINAPSGAFSFTHTTVFLPTEANVIGGRGDDFFTSDRYTLSTTEKRGSIDPATGEAAPEGATYGGLLVKSGNPTKTATFMVKGVNSVIGYLVSNNATESRTCHATVRPTNSNSSWTVDGTSASEGQTAVINMSLDPNQEYVIDFSDACKTGTTDGADMLLQGVRFVVDGTDAHLYTPTQYTQYSWDKNNSKVITAPRGDIRQGVHTVDYQVFISPNEINDNKKILKLPFEDYEGTYGNNLEPMAYIRWYDWSSDLGSSHLTKVGTWLKQLDDDAGNRGFFMLNNSVSGLHPTQERVGVTYDPTNLTIDGDIIACDVSKYYDGLYPGLEADDRADFSGKMYPHLVHEPTLSTRYLFHIYPSSVIAEKILTGHNALQEGINSLNGGSDYSRELKTSMFNNIYEENGRVVVSLNGSAGTFAVRADLYSLTNYYINGGWTQCNHISWYAYLEDERGLWERVEGAVAQADNRIQLLTLSALSGSYRLLSNTSTTKPVTAAPGMRFHLVGFVNGYKNGQATTNEQAAIHYELQFLDAPAIMAENLASTNVKRTTEYQEQNFRRGGVVNFDNYFEDLSEPTTEAKNMLFNPIPWKEAEYGFCYPTIDKYRIRTGWSGITPIHGDYMLVKSVKKANVSAQCDDSGDVPASGCEYGYHWYTYDPTILYDYTHLVNNSEYGGYIYVDASDESRTIATLDFTASLCSGSQIFFTAAIADLTSAGATSPQLMAHVYAKNEFGEKTQVISFLTSVLNTVNTGDGGSYKYNKWYQVYGHGNIPENIDISNYTKFSVEIDNYSKDTKGADFCVDEIRFYTSTGKMQVEQSGGQCVDEVLKVTAFMDAEHLDALITLGDTPRPIYYRIYKKTGTEANGQIRYEPYSDASIYNNKDANDNYLNYGVVQAYKCVVDENGELDATDSKNARYFSRGNVIYFKLLDDQVLNLPIGEEYYVATTENLEYPNPDGGLTDWANPNDPCDAYSNFFVPRRYYIYFLDQNGNQADQTIVCKCDDGASNIVNFTTVVNAPNDNEPTGFLALPTGVKQNLSATNGVLFDFFKETTDANNDGIVDMNDAIYELNRQHSDHGNKTLLEAIQAYRDFERNPPSGLSVTSYSSGEPAGGYKYQTEYGDGNAANYYGILKEAYDAGKLYLVADSKFDHNNVPILETTNFLAIPIKEIYNVSGIEYHLCDYMPFTITVSGAFNVPELTLGFDDVDYTEAGTERVIRVGLEQLNKMRTQGYKLHVPVNMYKDNHKLTAKRLYFPSDSYLTISATNDNTQSIGRKFAKIVPINSTDTRPYVDKNHMYLSLDLSGDNCTIDFHEGYQYEVATTFHDEDDEGNLADACIGDLFILIKVVPEFVTWYAQNVDDDGKPTDAATDYWSANWYNDGNWHRSVRSELYKGAVSSAATEDNHASAAHPNGYKNNTEINSSLTSDPGFVPMKFTYVTLLSGNHAPSLINEPKVVVQGVTGSKRQGGGFLDTSVTVLRTDRSPNPDPDNTPLESRHFSEPTENIYYDMLVRYSIKTNDPYGEGCFGHRYIKSDGTWADDSFDDSEGPKGLVFDCEKFYGNVCKEIYFKPSSEILRQHRLEYQKAWVEMDLESNKWYLRSAPLMNTYAGDMYVPYSTTATNNGRQMTEAFQPITFELSKGYSRTLYPIYQRSWGTKFASNVYVKTSDIRANSYSANLSFATPEEENFTIAEWGHTYNDVQVPYTTRTGFSIRAHKKDQKVGDDDVSALIRLPKADTEYVYYEWNDTHPDPAATVAKPDITVDNNGVLPSFDVSSANRLITDDHDVHGVGDDGVMQFEITDMQQIGDYVLVGNPYMASIDMAKFFTTNSGLDAGYWTYEASVASAKLTTGLIKPLQAFFVKKGTATQITFNRQMQIDGNFPTPPGGGSARQTTVTLSAANSRGSSSASLEVSEKASAGYVGGEDVETLFDSNLADVPMVYTVSADGQAVSINQLPALEVVPFGVSCSGDEMIDVTVDHSVYVFDALLGTTTAVNEGESVSIQPNDYGRYYLIVSEDASGLLTNKALTGITISVRDRVVTITSNDDINQVKAVNVSGATAYESTVGSKTTQFTLPTGTYIIDVNGVAGNKTVKILVK